MLSRSESDSAGDRGETSAYGKSWRLQNSLNLDGSILNRNDAADDVARNVNARVLTSEIPRLVFLKRLAAEKVVKLNFGNADELQEVNAFLTGPVMAE